MAAGNTQKKRRPRAAPELTIAEHLAPLAAAMPLPPSGRVQSLADARRALRIPTTSAPAILQLWGVPGDFQLRAYPVADDDHPGRVAEFALLRVVTRRERELIARPKHAPRLQLNAVTNALWVVYGSIATATDNSLVLESVTIAPAFDDQLHREKDVAHGITSQFLRLVSPPRILAACAEQLLSHRFWLDQMARQGAKPMSRKQRDLLVQIDEERPQLAQVSDDRLAEFAARYLTLYHAREPKLRQRLAGEYGLTLMQVRDRTHLARKRGYLSAGSRGRAGAEPGPRLIALGWKPPKPTPN